MKLLEQASVDEVSYVSSKNIEGFSGRKKSQCQDVHGAKTLYSISLLFSLPHMCCDIWLRSAPLPLGFLFLHQW